MDNRGLSEDISKQIQQLHSELSEYCGRLMINSSLANLDSLVLDLSLRKSQDRKKVTEIVERYKHLFSYIEIISPALEVYKELEKLNFKQYQILMSEHIETYVTEMKKDNKSNIYSLVVSITTEHGGISISYNTVDAFEETKKMLISKEPSKYVKESDFNYYKYTGNEYSLRNPGNRKSYTAREKELFALIDGMHGLLTESHRNFGSDLHSYVDYHNRYLFLENTILALQSGFPLIDSLDTTNDFVAFVQPIDMPWQTALHSIQRTVPEHLVGQVADAIPK